MGTLFGGSGFWAFTFWSTVVISGLLLGLAVFQILPTLEAKLPLLSKAKLGYVAVWTLLYVISSIISFVTFALNAILVYILLGLFVLDLFFHYRVYKTGSGPDATASNPTATQPRGAKCPSI